jgi:hypothetical protein
LLSVAHENTNNPIFPFTLENSIAAETCFLCPAPHIAWVPQFVQNVYISSNERENWFAIANKNETLKIQIFHTLADLNTHFTQRPSTFSPLKLPNHKHSGVTIKLKWKFIFNRIIHMIVHRNFVRTQQHIFSNRNYLLNVNCRRR